MPNPHYYGLILAGGRGTRFWPSSRRARAKQVLRIAGDRSLIQQTFDRLAPLVPPERLWVLTNHYLRREIVRQLPEIPAAQILAEPAQRNTAPAIGLGAHILCSLDPDAVMGVFPSDHVLRDAARYRQLVRRAFRAAGRGQIAVLGIQPRWPETGFGYIEFPAGTQAGSLQPSPVLRFREKPDAAMARRFVSAGRFFWNAGMFFWRADVLLAELRRYLPKTATLLAALPPFGDRRFASRLREAFPRCENKSVDYAVLEPASRAGSPQVVGLPCGEIGWSDLGSWKAVYELMRRDGDDNAGAAHHLFHDSRGNYVNAGDKLVALLGVNDLIVVDTPDALLIANRDQAQQVGDLVKLLEKRNRQDLL